MPHFALKRVGALAIVPWLLLLVGCAEGWSADAAQARAWLPGALPDLRRVLVLLQACQPTRPSGYDAIWVNGDYDGLHCAVGGTDAPIAEIRSKLRHNQILGVAWSPSGNATTPLAGATFTLFRHGLGLTTSSASTNVEYHRAPKPCAAPNEGSEQERYQVSRESIGQVPCQWFWEHDEQ